VRHSSPECSLPAGATDSYAALQFEAVLQQNAKRRQRFGGLLHH
jgi:hypothetical protein